MAFELPALPFAKVKEEKPISTMVSIFLSKVISSSCDDLLELLSQFDVNIFLQQYEIV